MKSATLTLPDGRSLNYRIRPSSRAKYMRLQYSAEKGLVVTRPLRASDTELNRWINSKLDWISQVSQNSTQQIARPLPELPDTINCPPINESIRVNYIRNADTQITANYQSEVRRLTLIGAVGDTEHCILVLQKWTQQLAKHHLGLLLQQNAQETGFSYLSYRVKDQKTRWGSCSSRGNINLNYKLLLMPPEWARYTMIHELCHTQEMNHSRRFWALVEKHMPDYRRIHESMKTAEKQLPDWANHRL